MRRYFNATDIYVEMRRQGYFTGAPLANCFHKLRVHNDSENMMKRLIESG